ncbi:phage tail spike protein [Staphylococcus felis]|uniref:phage tail spike protein n=1 Tax=Staphylococcus felis TaxID=46127 RepID=UPI0015F27C3B|nr:phage tail spike protein [Staphylococcus felis]
MIHVLNFNSQIIDFISRDDNAVTLAKYYKTKDNDLLDIRILSQRAEHFKKRNRIIIQDKNDVYREYIIDRAEENGRYVDVECTASHLVDISTSKPIPPGKYEKMTINQKLSETLRDSGWVVGDCDYAGLKTNSWTSVRTPLEMISQLETAHEVQADYEIEIDSYEVVERRVNMRIPAPLFKGKEIEYGKDLLSMKRVIDFSEVKTALYALGPEPEQGKRVETFVYDDEAQEQFNLPYRYIWGVYEPETEDDTMSLQRLTTLAKTELNKRKSAAVSYEISVVDIEKEFPHEVIRYGDIVRIKNPDFTPALYAESEVVGIEHDLISNKCVYEFGKVVEYQEDDLLRYFRSKLGYFNQKLNDTFTNVNTIVRESIDGELQYFERKIFKGSEAPENPVNDILWLDTSNPKVAVLRRYWNGEWINSTPENAEDVGAITREQAMYHDLKNTFINLNIQRSKLLNETHEILNSEYFVNNDLKSQVNAKLNDTIQVFNEIKQSLESMTEETATIGKLVDTQNLFLTYREKLQALYNVVENAKIAINERFKLLQSQYTDEKFNDAMSKVASTLPNGRWDSETQQLTSDIPNEERLQEIQQQLSIALNQNIAKISTTLQNYTDSEVKKAKDEISASVRTVKEDVQREIDNVSINVTEAKNSIKILQDSLLLTATKTDVQRTLDEQLNPLKNDVNEQKAQLQVMSDSIDSKVSQSDYTTDKDNIVQRLDRADTQRRQLSNEISDRVTLTQFNSGIDSTKQYADDKINNLEIGNVNLIRSYKTTQNIVNGTIEGDYAVRLPLNRNINFYYYDRNGDVNPPLEADTDYVLQLHEADADVDMGVFYNKGSYTVVPYSKERIVKFNTGDKTDFRIVIVARSDNQFVGKVSLYKGTKELDWTPNPLDVQKNIDNAETNAKAYADSLKIQQDEVLTEYQTQIQQNGRDINARATVEEFNASRKTLSRVLADLTINTTTGLSLNYDENGAIQSHTIGPGGVKIDTTKFVINDGDVVVQNGRTTIKDAYIDKLFSKQATIEYLKAIDIDLNRATVSGSRDGESTVLSGGKIRSTGSFTRTFPQGSVTYEAYTESWNGVYRSGLISKSFGSKKLTDITRWLSLTDKGITTQREIHSLSPDKNGSRFIDFFADETFDSDVSGQGMHVYSGQALTIESEYGFYLKTNNYFYIRTQDSGIEINQNGGSLVLKRTSPFTSTNFSGGSYLSIKSSDDVEQGHVGILSNNRHMSVRAAYGEILLKGNKVFALDGDGSNRVPIHAKYFEGEKLIGSIEAPDTNVYAMCNSELRVTDKNGYNSGNVNYKNIRFNSWNAMSHEKFKYDIEEWNYSVLEIFRKELQLHSYKVKSEAGTEYNQIHHGIILRENSNLDQFPVEWRNSDGFDGNEVLWWNAKAIQELAKENDDLKSRIKEMENKIDTILEAIK